MFDFVPDADPVVSCSQVSIVDEVDADVDSPRALHLRCTVYFLRWTLRSRVAGLLFLR